MSEAYDIYLNEHIGAVQFLYKEFWGEELDHKHDESKYSKEEYDAYDAYFYPKPLTNKSEASKYLRNLKIDRDFDYAWLHHLHNNPHHWQYWVLNNDDGTKTALDMPLKYIKEMLADWAAFSYIQGENKLIEWYNNNRDKQVMSKLTRERVKKYLPRVSKILDRLIKEK